MADAFLLWFNSCCAINDLTVALILIIGRSYSGISA